MGIRAKLDVTWETNGKSLESFNRYYNKALEGFQIVQACILNHFSRSHFPNQNPIPKRGKMQSLYFSALAEREGYEFDPRQETFISFSTFCFSSLTYGGMTISLH